MSDSPRDSLERLREQVIEQLSSGYSRDLLSEAEFEDRLTTATNASAHADLRTLILDLPLVGSPNAPAPYGGADALSASDGEQQVAINRGEVRDESSVIAIFSGADRKGVWDPPKTLNVVAIFGGSDIDLREARIPAGGMTINAVAMFGGVDIIVPDGVRVETSGAGIFGAFEGKERTYDLPPGSPTIKVEGVAIFGAVEVKQKQKRKGRGGRG
ncbi:MAG: DUF1707 and DUF2154 domain-containing protein [Spirochaetaceae bacterium]|nr:MAG: DUF1707 and DUF2154 domain-containing protein [Spirochaetaceae bacterium]